jgi:putative ABC transport system permease protein
VLALPGVQAAAAVNPLPFSGSVWRTFIRDAARPEPPPAERLAAHYKSATSDYFGVMGIPLKRGRAFSETDVRGRTGVVVLNETLARQLFADQDPLGQRVKFGVGIDEKDEDAAWEIVGVVGDAALDRLDANPTPTFYVSGWQQPWGDMSLVVRSSLDPSLLGESIRKQVYALDPEVPWYRVLPMRQLLAGSVALRRFQSILLSAFAGTGLLLACVGLYGVMAFSVAVRTREIGIRMALGAERRRVLRLLLGHGIGLVALGSSIGLIGALGLARLLESLLFRIHATDPPTYGAAALLLLATALLACYLPARRAAKVDPMLALRQE